MRRGAAIAWFVIGLAACNAIAGLDGDFGVGDGGAATPSSSSGGSSSSSTSSTSSTSSSGDGSTTSSSSGSTTSSSGTTSSSSSTTSSTTSSGTIDSGSTLQFCDRPEDKPWDFCWNFNGTETAAQKWGAFEVYQQGAAPTVEPTVAGTEKGALHAVNATNFGSTGLVWNVPTGDNSKRTRVLEFRFRAASINYYAAVAVFQMNGTEHGLAVSTKCPSSASPCFVENQPDAAQNPRAVSTASLAADTSWHSGLVKMTYAPANDLWSGEVRVDGTVIATRNDAIGAANQAATYQVVAGAFFGGANAGLKTNDVYVDNLRVHLE